MSERLDFSPYRPIEFLVRGPFCAGGECSIHPDLAALRFEVKEVYGTSPQVAAGERYVVRGEYSLPGPNRFALLLAVSTKCFGATAHLLPGQGRFEISTEILELTSDPPNGLGVVAANEATGKADIVRWVLLATDDAATPGQGAPRVG